MTEKLIGIEYIQSPAKERFDRLLARAIHPATRLASVATELALHGNVSLENHYFQTRGTTHPLQLEKIKTMRDPLLAETMDINRHSPRILNRRAHFARIVGLDELPQWRHVMEGEMSVVGPRPMLQESVDAISFLAASRLGDDSVEEWRDFLRSVKPGILGRSQALRHRLGVDEYSASASARTVQLDLDYKVNASMAEDVRILTASPIRTAFEGMKFVCAYRKAASQSPIPSQIDQAA